MNKRRYPSREKLLSQLMIDVESGCVLWTGQKDKDGYGVISNRRVHRVAWEMFEGPIPPGLVIDHVKARGCVNRHCAAIAHLEPVTDRENLLRGDTVNAANASKTHCIHGHEFSEANTFGKGRRRCRICHREQGRARRAARKAETAAQLEIGNPAENNRALKTHCIRGHEFTEANTYWRPDGNRDCRKCKAIRGHRSEEKRRDAINAWHRAYRLKKKARAA